MTENRTVPRSRTLRSGKIAFNHGHSVVDCTIRNLSAQGACLDVESLTGIPDNFILVIANDGTRHTCRVMWKSEPRIGVAFEQPIPERRSASVPDRRDTAAQPAARTDAVRSELLTLRAGLDEVPFGVVLLDEHLRAQFINRAFRAIWHLPDAKADAKPSYVSLLQHGREIGAYEVFATDMEAYIADRVAHVKAGNPAPVDLRLTNGQALRFQCTALPAGGRMLSYTPVTDIVRHADDLDVLRDALDVMPQGIILLDADLNARFVNHAARKLWHVPVRRFGALSYADIVNNAYELGLYDIPQEKLDTHVAERIASVRAGNAKPADLRINDGRVIRSQCTALPGGGRMLSYMDVTDLARHDAPSLVPHAGSREPVA